MKRGLKKYVQQERMDLYADILDLRKKQEAVGLTEEETTELNVKEAQLSILDTVHELCSSRARY